MGLKAIPAIRPSNALRKTSNDEALVGVAYNRRVNPVHLDALHLLPSTFSAFWMVNRGH